MHEQQIRDNVLEDKEPPKEPDPEENTVEKRLERAEVKLAQQETDKANENYRNQTFAALEKLNEPHKLPPKAKKLVDVLSVAMLRGSNSDISVEHGKSVVALKEALVEYNDHQKEIANANKKAQVFANAGAGQRSGGAIPQLEPDKPKTVEHVKSGAALSNIDAVLKELRGE